MKKSVLAILIVLFLALILSIFFILSLKAPNISQNISNSTNQNISNSNSEGDISSIKVSTTELSKHNSENDCWVVYRGKVYDVTSWLPRHPGGVQAIAQFCGTLGFEEAFTQKHGTSKADLFMKVTTYEGEFVQ